MRLHRSPCFALLVTLLPLSAIACGSVESSPPPAPVDAGADGTGLNDSAGGDDTAAPPVDATPEAPADTAPVCDDSAVTPPDAGPVTCLIKPPPPPSGDAGVADTGPTGAISTVYPAFPLDPPQLINLGGRILDRMQIVPITWSGDADAAKLEDFTDKIGGSTYWNSVTCEYGIGPATVGACNHVHMTEPLSPTFSQDDADAFVSKNASNWETSGWPKPNKETIYVLYLPPSVDLQIAGRGGSGSACAQGVGGYHTSAVLKDGTKVAYAVLPRCSFFGPELETTTSSASHELAEAATDALPGMRSDPGSPAYRGFDDAHIAWTAFQVLQTENGDICEFYADSFYRNAELGYQVQRTWSNASIAGGHAPCVPADPAPYFNATPLDLGFVSFTFPAALGGSTVDATGINIPVGETGSFHVGYYSDGPMDADWDLKALEGNGIPGTSPTGGPGAAFANGNLVITVDNPHGRNGNKATVTVKVKGTDSLLGANLVTLVSTSKGLKHYWPVLVTSN